MPVHRNPERIGPFLKGWEWPNPLNSRVFLVQSGCLLPFLLIFNLFFGRLFFKVRVWLIIEVVLFLLFLVTGYMASRRIRVSSPRHKDTEIIDVSAEVIEEKKKIS